MNKLLSFFVVVPRIRFSSFFEILKKRLQKIRFDIMYTMLRSSHITRHFSSSSLLPPLKVAICGAGTVGGGVIEILSKRQDEVKGLRRTSSSFSSRKKNVLQLLCFTQSLVSHLSFFIKKSALQLLETQCSNESTR